MANAILPVKAPMFDPAERYQLTATGSVTRQSDGLSIPDDPMHPARAAYNAWLAAGGVADPYADPTKDAAYVAEQLRQQAIKADANLADLVTKLKTLSSAQFTALVRNATQSQKDNLVAAVLMLLATRL